MHRDALRPPFMAVMDLLADSVALAGAVSLDVEVPVSGVRRIGTGPQNGCEPTACSGSQRCENSHFPLVLRFSNRKDFAVREFETGNIHRQATRMGAELATNLMISVATHEPGPVRTALKGAMRAAIQGAARSRTHPPNRSANEHANTGWSGKATSRSVSPSLKDWSWTGLSMTQTSFFSAATSPGSTLSPSCCSCAKHFEVADRASSGFGVAGGAVCWVRAAVALGRGQRDDAVALGPRLPKRTRQSRQRR